MFLCACSGSPSGPGVDAADTAAPETRGDAAEEDAGGPPPSRILAATPPMGWNSWNLFACDIDQDLILSTAEAMVESGMAALGYEYVNLDDCWQVDRDADGVIVADPERFPDGIAALADAVHALGLKLGVYTCAGTLTCQERPGSFGYEALDMATYAAWGVDYVKVDWCFAEELDAAERYGLFRDGIAATGREMMLSICNWGFQEPWVWGPETGQLWRTSGDIQDSLLPLLVNLFAVEPLAPFAGPGRWNDPDMLEVGNGGMDNDLYRAHFGLWAILAAPLLAGNDLRDMDPETLAILTNPEIIAVDQDALGLQAVLLRVTDGVRVYARPLAGDGIRAVL
ncbi:MAG: glycoside hydrolase family 27 protein, partial [Deltaproteobacteria bacterium]|nr:glycoside hydrolase family 27 protein [Deltaproteobacteria bacterium]